MVLLFADHPALFLTSSSAALLLTGHISGCVYYNTAMYFAGSRYTGRLIGMGMGAAILLQFVVQNLMPQSVIFIISILLSVAFVMCFIIKAPKDWILENPLPYSADTKKEFKKALLLIVAVVLMSLVAGMIDSVLTAFPCIGSCTFWDGVGKVQDGDQWILIDTRGNVVVDDPGFSGFYSCGNGLIAYQDAESGLWGYMTTDGKIAIEARFLSPDTFFPAD